jgi:2-methylisocitrate lyase-like PEP mutase family enzyme
VSTASGPGLSSGGKLRQLLSERRSIIAPGILDPLSASLIESLGYECMCSGGLVTTMELRIPESTISLLDTVDTARRITHVTDVPLIVDGESGFGDSQQVARTIHELERVGAAATHIEDSRFPRPRNGIAMVPIDEMAAKIKTAVASRDDPDFMIIARTEAYKTPGGGIDEVRRRLDAYAEAGADVLMPMVFDHEHAARIGQEYQQLPLVYLGRTLRDEKPELSVTEIAAMGYQLILYAIGSITVAAHAIVSMHQNLINEGKTGMDQEMVREVWERLERLVKEKSTEP